MTTHSVAKNYWLLTPQERFRLILAASERGDDAERDRLVRAGGRITFTMGDHAPYANAFQELAILTYLEILEEAARYLEAIAWAELESLGDLKADEVQEGEEGNADEPTRPQGDEPTLENRSFDLILACGYILRTKVDGWKRFCAELNVSPWLLMQGLPGSERIERALSMAEGSDSLPGLAFTEEGFLKWFNRNRPSDDIERKGFACTVKKMATECRKCFRERAEWFGGRRP